MSRNFARAVPDHRSDHRAHGSASLPRQRTRPRQSQPLAKATSAVPAVTRAALDPALVAGRGADLGFAEQEAETAATNGTIIGPGTSAYTLPAEASGRSAVSLTPGQYVEFTLPSAANAITVRYSIPDAPSGGGITAPLDVTVNGGDRQTMTLTSQYAWLYNQYPFSNDPNAVAFALPRPVGNRVRLRSRPDDAGAGDHDNINIQAELTSTTRSDLLLHRFCLVWLPRSG